MLIPSFPSRSKECAPRAIYPFVVIPMLALLLIVGAFTFNAKSQAAPAHIHVQHSAKNLPAVTPASSTWYFDVGSVGGGFQEYLTMENPDATTDANVTITYLLEANPPVNPVHIRKAVHTIAAATRQTIDVDKDLLTSTNGPHIDASAIVQVTSGPNIIVESPWYFNNLGVSTGTDTFGAITPQQNFYFAEADSLNAAKPGQPDYNTFVELLNPSATTTANATVTYYNGSCGGLNQAVCQKQQASLIPYQRVTLKPTIGLGFHAKFSIAVTSDNPIVAERLMYIKDNIPNVGAGLMAGAIMGVGATNPGSDWLFAEGYTGAGFQEDYELANFGATAANAQIKLEYINGATQTISVTVPALSKVEYDVNNANRHPTGTCVPSPCRISDSFSAEITSNNPIVAERMMWFRFGPNHISGTTDAVGTPAAQSTYAFAEGYTLGSFVTFLTLQNPTANAETATVTYYLTTTSFSEQYSLPAHSRTTINVNTRVASRGGGAVSMLVTATGTMVAERPMYFIYGTWPGGSDVIGFTGT